MRAIHSAHRAATRTTGGLDGFLETYAEEHVKGEKRELVEALGFDPSAISSEQLDQAMAVADLIWDDPALRSDITRFARDYVTAQHAVELTNLSGSAAFEVLFTIILAAATAGVGLAVGATSHARHLAKFRKVGDLLMEFAEQAKKVHQRLRHTTAKKQAKSNRSLDQLSVEDVSITKESFNKPSSHDRQPKSSHDPKTPSRQEIALAKQPGSSLAKIQAREKVARHYMSKNGFSESQISDALGSKDGTIVGGVDLTKPLEVVQYPPPDYMYQYVKSHGYPGNWFDPIGDQAPDMLGISGEGRTLKSFKMPNGSGLKSYSKPILDEWTNPEHPIQTNGGGVQLLINDATKSSVNTINGLS